MSGQLFQLIRQTQRSSCNRAALALICCVCVPLMSVFGLSSSETCLSLNKGVLSLLTLSSINRFLDLIDWSVKLSFLRKESHKSISFTLVFTRDMLISFLERNEMTKRRPPCLSVQSLHYATDSPFPRHRHQIRCQLVLHPSSMLAHAFELSRVTQPEECQCLAFTFDRQYLL